MPPYSRYVVCMVQGTRKLEERTGMKPRFLWNVAVAAFVLPGFVLIAVWRFQLAPNPIPTIAVVIGGLGPLLPAVAWYAMGRRGVNPYPWFHLALAIGCLFLLIPPQVDDNANSADAVYQLLPAVIAIIMFTARQAFPYILFAVIGSALLVATGGDATPAHRAVTAAFVAGAILVIIGLGQHRLHRALLRNRMLSEFDELTQALNMRALRHRLEAAIADTRGAEDTSLSLISLDLDDFKSVNDTHGHSTGDRMLANVAQAIREQLSPGEILARRGGDEFLIMTARGPEPAAELAARVRASVIGARMRLCPEMTADAGVALIAYLDEESLDDMLARADAALYEVKEASHGGSPTDRREPATDLTHTPRIGSLAPVTVSTDSEASFDISVRRTAWRLLAAFFAVLAMTPLLALIGSLEGFFSGADILIFGPSAVLAATALFAGRRPMGARWLGIGLVLALVVLTAVIAQAGEGRNALIDLFILPAALACYAVGARVAAVYATVAMVLFGYFLTTTPMPEIHGVRMIQTAVIVGLVCIILPGVVKRGRRTVAENERLSGIDPLTGVANVRAMRHRLATELNRIDDARELTLLAIDLDNFKLVNDRYGHTTGDRLLRAVARAIKGKVRDEDLVVRRGGDEFVAVVAHDGEIDPQELAERIEQEIADARTAICPDLNPLASVGWVTGRPGDTPAELLARADSKEKAAKRLHRSEPGLRAIA